jgi:hypothetical protein
MIRGVHTMFYSSKADELRAFVRDKLKFPAFDVGGGWLIFDLPEADMGVHPADPAYEHAKAGTHSISFYCDNVKSTVAEMKSRGVEFIDDIQDHGYGLVTNFRMPGGVVVQLYQPLYKKAKTKPKTKDKTKAKIITKRRKLAKARG